MSDETVTSIRLFLKPVNTNQVFEALQTLIAKGIVTYKFGGSEKKGGSVSGRRNRPLSERYACNIAVFDLFEAAGVEVISIHEARKCLARKGLDAKGIGTNAAQTAIDFWLKKGWVVRTGTKGMYKRAHEGKFALVADGEAVAAVEQVPSEDPDASLNGTEPFIAKLSDMHA